MTDSEQRRRVEHAVATAQLRFLLAEEDPSPGQLRRIGELAELLYDGIEVARPWYEKAAAAGDRDSIDLLTILGDPPPSEAETRRSIDELRQLLRRLPCPDCRGEERHREECVRG